MVSKASDDLPEPDRPVMTTSASRGSSTVTSLRLCSRAPATTMDSWRDIRLPLSLRGPRTEPSNTRSHAAQPLSALCGGQQPGVLQLGAQVAQEGLHPQLLPGHPPQELARVELAAVAVDVL